jgi:hypothetical protein
MAGNEAKIRPEVEIEQEDCLEAAGIRRWPSSALV